MAISLAFPFRPLTHTHTYNSQLYDVVSSQVKRCIHHPSNVDVIVIIFDTLPRFLWADPEQEMHGGENDRIKMVVKCTSQSLGIHPVKGVVRSNDFHVSLPKKDSLAK